MAKVKKGDKVKVEYTGMLEDGTVFDSSDKYEAPFEFTVGSGQVIQGFDNAVVGMEQGEEKEFTLPPDKAYGSYNPELVKDMPKTSFPENKDINPGMIFVMNTKDGKQIPFRIAKVTDEMVTIDLNPPLAGKTLKFKIKILEIAA